MSKMKLTTSPLSYNSLRVDMVLAEKVLDPSSTYDLIPADMMRSTHKTEDFRSKSLFSRVPMLEDGDLVLFESRAIGRYLAEKYADVGPRLMPAPDASLAERARWEMWFITEVDELNMHGVILNSQLVIQPLLGNKTEQFLIDRYTPKLFNCPDVFDKHLAESKQDFFASDYFSLVDINLMPMMHMLTHAFGKEKLFDSRDALASWWRRVNGRGSWQKVVQQLDDAYSQFAPNWKHFQ